MKIISDDQFSYIPLWIYADKSLQGFDKQLPFTELGKLFFNEFGIIIKYSCITSVNVATWKDFLSKDVDTIHNVLSFVLKYLWECENIGAKLMNTCDHIILIYNAQSLQQIHRKLADESTDLKSKWKNCYIADRYSEYEDYLVNNIYKSDKTNCRINFS